MTNQSEKYADLDKAVMGNIGETPKRFISIFDRRVEAECERIAKEDASKAEPFRVLDRRLQALRRAGKIKSTTKGWVLASAK